jgi:DNA helicase II / ATP-dependent DNA helicase PcrA
MTRAKTDLHLIAPLKYYIASQSRMGDRHVYGAKSRFMTRTVLACMEPVAYGDVHESESVLAGKTQVDVAAGLRKMWT